MRFVEPMLLLGATKLPEGWLTEIKLDGFRALAWRLGGTVSLRSRNDNDFTKKFPGIAAALKGLPDNTMLDGEIVALDERGVPSFSLLQNAASRTANIVFYAFDVLCLKGEWVMDETLRERRTLLETKVLPHLNEPVRYSVHLAAPMKALVAEITKHGFEGVWSKYWNVQRIRNLR
jgi:bifunctional non-homologous end joining protein LigD